MAVTSEGSAGFGEEFALVAETAAEVGIAADALPKVRRGWVNVPAGGHVSGVFWGTGAPQIVYLHDRGRSARAWDAVALATGRPAVAIDLPGHGRSDWRRDGQYAPVKLVPAVAEAIRSFAPRAGLVVGTGLGGRTALALRQRQPGLVRGLVIVASPPQAADPAGPERFASQEEAFAALAARRPGSGEREIRREVGYELVQDADGSWAWRHHPGNLPPEPVASQPVTAEDASAEGVIGISETSAAAVATALDEILRERSGRQQ